jgi:2',3'-cyclic-nucleotide 2'-phosphodiesterase / 3'-nucleotidase / 5'-nucleotidase
VHPSLSIHSYFNQEETLMVIERLLIGVSLLSIVGTPIVVEASDSKSITLKQIGRYGAGASTTPEEARAEISAFDPVTKRLFSINLNLRQLDVLDLGAPDTPVLVQTVPLGGKPNSVAVHNGIVAVALEGPQKTDPGSVKFFNASGALLNQVTVGALPDMLTFSPNGRWLLVANEGEPNSYNQADSVDPDGSVSVIDMRGDVTGLNQANVRTASFSSSIPQENPSSIRIFGPNATIAKDLEPEYITVSKNSQTAWVTLQENNALAVLDIPSASFTRIIGLGFKDHLHPNNTLDASDRDVSGSSNNGIINIRNWPVLGMYQPDSIASYRVKGKTYLVMANEGDARDYPGFSEEARVGSLTLDAAAFAAQGYPDVTTGVAGLRNNDNLGRLTVTNTLGNTDGDAEFEKLYVFGARSFSIRNADGGLVYDSGNELEQRTAALVPTIFNSNGAADTFDTRSDNKGPEPEGLALGKIGGRTYAFIGLERTGGIIAYDITEPQSPQFVTYANTGPTDISPEGLLFIKKSESPNGKPLLVVSHEVSNTVTIFEIERTKQDGQEEYDKEDNNEEDNDEQ